MRRGKYNAVRTTVDGIMFASKLEANTWRSLQNLARFGKIKRLARQVPFLLEATCSHGLFSVRYIADFTFVDTHSGEFHVVDVKGMLTPMFRLKAKLFRACYGWDVEVWK